MPRPPDECQPDQSSTDAGLHGASPPDPLADIRCGFFLECDELLEGLSDALAAPDFGDPAGGSLHAAFRAVHTIKGGAASLGMADLAAFAHQFESDLDALRSGPTAEPAPDQPAPDLPALIKAADHLSRLVEASRSGQAIGEETPPRDPKPDAADRPPPANGVNGDWLLDFHPEAGLYASGNEPLYLLAALEELGATAIRCDLSALPDLEELLPEQGYLTWTIRLPGRIEPGAILSVFDFVEDVSQLRLARAPETGPDRDTDPHHLSRPDGPPHFPPPPPLSAQMPGAPLRPATPPSADGGTIRVDLDRIDRLMNLIGELVIGQSMLTERLTKAGIGRHSPAEEALGTLATLTRDLQEAVMVIRSQPVKPLFQRMGRVMREAAQALDRPADLICEGEMTEVDRLIVERLADPLTHMIRNAIDHGIEDRATRVAAGKPAVGRITLAAAHRSGRIIIELADDGRGIDRDRVKSAAIVKGLIAPDARPSDAEIDALLFHPGFSTARTVTTLSGRGVGMDVVRASLHALGGRISITSVAGQGTRFTMSLPLTLAVLNGMLVRARGQTLVLPLTAVLETALPDPAGGGGPAAPLMRMRGRHVSVCDLGASLGFPLPADRTEAAHPVAILVADEDDRQIALLVDRIIDQQQFVIKGLTGNCGKLPGIAAATILGDGQVALILDPADLIRHAARLPGGLPEPARV